MGYFWLFIYLSCTVCHTCYSMAHQWVNLKNATVRNKLPKRDVIPNRSYLFLLLSVFYKLTLNTCRIVYFLSLPSMNPLFSFSLIPFFPIKISKWLICFANKICNQSSDYFGSFDWLFRSFQWRPNKPR